MSYVMLCYVAFMFLFWTTQFDLHHALTFCLLNCVGLNTLCVSLTFHISKIPRSAGVLAFH